MNYLLELKAFYDWLEVNQIPTPAIVLWHALMHIANKTGWKDTFTVAIAVLEVKTGLKRQAILNARNILKIKERILFESRSGNQSSFYRIIPLCSNTPYTVSFKQTQSDIHTDIQENTYHNMQTHTINKQNITKQKYIEKDSSLNVEKSKNQKTQTFFSYDSFEFMASKYLRDSIIQFIPKANVPKDDLSLQKWALHIDFMKRLDNLTEDEIKTLIKFATEDGFWRTNILSTKKLREKKDMLYARVKEKQITYQQTKEATNLPKSAQGLAQWIQKRGLEG